MKFSYYARLGARDKAIYRKSDAITDVPLPDRPALRPLAADLEGALVGEARGPVQRAAKRLTWALCDQLEVARVEVRVLAARPRSAESELHGLYERDEESDDPPVIRVWMRTSAHRKVVRFRTFLRTLLHEVVHHLDYELFKLEDSFHTEGFFRRESSLARQLLPPKRGKVEAVEAPPEETLSASESPPARRAKRSRPSKPSSDRRQLDLPF